MTTPEFSRLVEPESLGAAPSRLTLRAEPAEREALARRFGLVALESFVAELRLTAAAGREIIVEGRIAASVTQSCVVTLEPVAATIDESFRLVFRAIEQGAEVELDAESDDVEPLPDGPLDVGETVAQLLALAIDPYPRAPGVAWSQGDSVAPGTESGGPFAALLRRIPPGK